MRNFYILVFLLQVGKKINVYECLSELYSINKWTILANLCNKNSKHLFRCLIKIKFFKISGLTVFNLLVESITKIKQVLIKIGDISRCD